MSYNEHTIKKIQESVAAYPDRGGALMSALYQVQNNQNWLSQDMLQDVSDALNIPPAAVKGVATFYSMYRQTPCGRNLIQICTNVACMVMGAERLVDLLKKEYGLESGGTTEDGRFSLIIMECIGACGTAPAMLINDDFHDSLDEERIREILKGYK